ncbi:hypothetical protein LIER_27701 [Lithospermum erythrorhizon]|uniref:Uncharacterized protein n=1 Tax=Lithospermum erythrorhizon TaxID=34254 RepID=A0AAV3RGX1_LITER
MHYALCTLTQKPTQKHKHKKPLLYCQKFFPELMGSDDQNNLCKPHYDISMSKRTRKPLNFQGIKLTKIEEQEEICPKVSEEEQEKQDHDNNKKCLKQLIEGRDSLGQQFLKEENQLQMVVKMPEDSSSNGRKFKKMVSQYAKVLGNMIKIKRNGKPGYNKRHVLPLSK